MFVAGSAIQKLGFFLITLFGIWGFGLSLWVIHDLAGVVGVLVSLFLTPIAFVLAPIYAGFWLNDWAPAIVSFAAPAISWVIVFAGLSLQGDNE